MRNFLTIFAICLMAAMPAAASEDIVNQGSVGLRPADYVTDIEFFTPEIVRVTKRPADASLDKQSLAIIADKCADVKVNKKSSSKATTYSTDAITVKVGPDGAVTFLTPKGKVLLAEAGEASFTPRDDAGRATYAVAQTFRLDPKERIFGLGIPQNGKMSQRGEDRDLQPDNTADGIPFFQSTKGYGLYWDNYSTTRFTDNDQGTTFASQVGDCVDYYFIYGGDADGVIAGVRHLTGDVPMSPLWTFGFHQSKERYKSQDETVGVLKRYRADGVPIDCVIQDWQYWGNNYMWNAMEFMNEEFPDPARMMREIHDDNAHCLISIWSSFGPMTKPYRELDSKGLLMDLETWPQSGISHIWPPRMDYPSGVRVYNPYSPEARDIYWKHLTRLYDLGLDGWWMDSTEPDHFNWKDSDFDYQTGAGSYRSLRLAFPLVTVGGVYDHQRAVSDSTRVFILTRSASFGQQRYGAQVWSGDVVSTWDILRKQVTAGLNFSLTGNPNFNSDLGGFFAGSYNGSWNGKPATQNPAYHELYARWMQQGVFTPMMRSHGADVPREIYLYGKPGEPVYDALLGAIKLRYRLLPYTYSTARRVCVDRDTYMRALAMDFPRDQRAVDCPSEYMYGRSILVAPVLYAQHTPEVLRHDSDANAGWDKNTGRTSLSIDEVDFTATKPHTVYLPKGTKWHSFDGKEVYDGGRELTFDVALTDIPIFVKAGGIVPIGPDVQYTGEKPWDDLEIRVYLGADGKFVLYEDSGDSYDYENGMYTEIPITWNDKERSIIIGERRGSYPGMLESRTFHIVLSDGSDTEIPYDGRRTGVKFFKHKPNVFGL